MTNKITIDLDSDLFPAVGEDDVINEFDPDDDIDLIDSQTEPPTPYGFTWNYDFNNEDLDFSSGGNPPKSRGIGVVNEWIRHTVNVEQYETPIFDGDIGTQIFSLIGGVLDGYSMSRVRDEVVRAIAKHDRITALDTIQVFYINNNVYVYLTYETDDSLLSGAILNFR